MKSKNYIKILFVTRVMIILKIRECGQLLLCVNFKSITIIYIMVIQWRIMAIFGEFAKTEVKFAKNRNNQISTIFLSI